MTRRRRNPDDAVLIYPSVEKIFATKGPEAGELAGPYVHDFKTKPRLYGLPNGDLLLTTRRRNPIGAAIKAGLGLAAAMSRPRRRMRTR